MDRIKAAEKTVSIIVERLMRLDFDAIAVAGMLSKQSGAIQYRIWKLIRELIRAWNIDAKYQQYDQQYVEIYKWAERIDND
jgi:hypothetical protein